MTRTPLSGHEIVETIGDQAEVYMDGGVRRGSDIVKAICLGARWLIGRAYAYGLAAGYSGVFKVLSILREDFEPTLRLLGCESTASLNSGYVRKCHGEIMLAYDSPD